MRMRKEKVECPLLGRELDEELCADAAFVAEDIHPERFAPKEIQAMKNWRTICQECKNNPCNEELS